jgi:hypothetical protein
MLRRPTLLAGHPSRPLLVAPLLWP